MRVIGLFLFLNICLFSAAQNINLNNGLVTYYPFNGNANDESGNGNNGIVHGANLIKDRFNNPNSAYEFNGSTYIELPENIYIYGDFTICFWVNIRDVKNWSRIIDFGSGPWSNNVAISSSFELSGKPCLSICDNSNCNNIVSNNTLELNQWIFLCFTLKDNNVEIYKDGVLWSNYSNAKTPQKVYRSKCYIGKSNWSDNANSNAIIDDIRIYNRVLNESEIQTLNSITNIITGDKSDVDINIPINTTSKSNTYALIIGNEDYSSSQTSINSEVNVQFAVNDAKIFKEYCIKTLSIPEKNIILLTNATGSKMLQNLDLISKIAKANDGNAELIFYYAGHGLPDEQTKEPYLIPVDVSGSDLKYAVKLADIFMKLTENPSKKVTAFIDACFSGGARNESLLSLRGVKVKPKENIAGNNLVVFASSSEDESSASYKDKQHGIFTYYLLKKLQDTKGDCSYYELEEYLKREISINSLIINKKQQTPRVIGSPDVGESWKLWRLK